ncbi:hypothetical protein GE09DRAFT_1289640 [Coniochaeta sp. 2T2.1]|nr:hypothetical protein GE09DRAFT_1289640 [Coniochaeta sp. 2T2.1]
MPREHQDVPAKGDQGLKAQDSDPPPVPKTTTSSKLEREEVPFPPKTIKEGEEPGAGFAKKVDGALTAARPTESTRGVGKVDNDAFPAAEPLPKPEPEVVVPTPKKDIVDVALDSGSEAGRARAFIADMAAAPVGEKLFSPSNTIPSKAADDGSLKSAPIDIPESHKGTPSQSTESRSALDSTRDADDHGDPSVYTLPRSIYTVNRRPRHTRKQMAKDSPPTHPGNDLTPASPDIPTSPPKPTFFSDEVDYISGRPRRRAAKWSAQPSSPTYGNENVSTLDLNDPTAKLPAQLPSHTDGDNDGSALDLNDPFPESHAKFSSSDRTLKLDPQLMPGFDGANSDVHLPEAHSAPNSLTGPSEKKDNNPLGFPTPTEEEKDEMLRTLDYFRSLVPPDDVSKTGDSRPSTPTEEETEELRRRLDTFRSLTPTDDDTSKAGEQAASDSRIVKWMAFEDSEDEWEAGSTRAKGEFCASPTRLTERPPTRRNHHSPSLQSDVAVVPSESFKTSTKIPLPEPSVAAPVLPDPPSQAAESACAIDSDEDISPPPIRKPRVSRQAPGFGMPAPPPTFSKYTGMGWGAPRLGGIVEELPEPLKRKNQPPEPLEVPEPLKKKLKFQDALASRPKTTTKPPSSRPSSPGTSRSKPPGSGPVREAGEREESLTSAAPVMVHAASPVKKAQERGTRSPYPSRKEEEEEDDLMNFALPSPESPVGSPVKPKAPATQQKTLHTMGQQPSTIEQANTMLKAQHHPSRLGHVPQTKPRQEKRLYVLSEQLRTVTDPAAVYTAPRRPSGKRPARSLRFAPTQERPDPSTLAHPLVHDPKRDASSGTDGQDTQIKASNGATDLVEVKDVTDNAEKDGTDNAEKDRNGIEEEDDDLPEIKAGKHMRFAEDEARKSTVVKGNVEVVEPPPHTQPRQPLKSKFTEHIESVETTPAEPTVLPSPPTGQHPKPLVEEQQLCESSTGTLSSDEISVDWSGSSYDSSATVSRHRWVASWDRSMPHIPQAQETAQAAKDESLATKGTTEHQIGDTSITSPSEGDHGGKVPTTSESRTVTAGEARQVGPVTPSTPSVPPPPRQAFATPSPTSEPSNARSAFTAQTEETAEYYEAMTEDGRCGTGWGNGLRGSLRHDSPPAPAGPPPLEPSSTHPPYPWGLSLGSQTGDGLQPDQSYVPATKSDGEERSIASDKQEDGSDVEEQPIASDKQEDGSDKNKDVDVAQLDQKVERQDFATDTTGDNSPPPFASSLKSVMLRKKWNVDGVAKWAEHVEDREDPEELISGEEQPKTSSGEHEDTSSSGDADADADDDVLEELRDVGMFRLWPRNG